MRSAKIDDDEVSSRLFLLVNGLIVIFLAFLFLRNRGPRLKKSPLDFSQSEEALGTKSTQERLLNCLFNYNGHTWDAFEILGLPAGANFQQAEEAFKKCCAEAKNEDSRHFYEAAFESLKTQLKYK